MQVQTNQYSESGGWTSPLDTAADHEQTLVLAFGASGYGERPGPIDDLLAAFPRSVLVGCSTAGEIAGAQVRDGTISVAVARFRHTRLRLAVAEIAAPDQSEEAGVQLARQLQGEQLRAVFVLSDGLGVNGTPLVAGLTRHLPADVLVSGGLAGDGSRFEQTWIVAGARPRPGIVCAVGFYGERLRVGTGCDDGWTAFGPRRVITRSSGNVLYELDHKPALDLYKEYLGELAEGLPGSALLFPMAIRAPGSTERPKVRTILGLDEASRSLTFAGDVPIGHEARLMRSSAENLIDSAAGAFAQAKEGIPETGRPLVISVSCVGRRLLLGERTDEELEAAAAAGAGLAAHLGFFSYGEISPRVAQGISELHNQTFTVTAFVEV